MAADSAKKPGKGAILALLMGPKKKPMGDGEEEPEGDEGSTPVVAAQAVLDAIEAKDAKGLADAMKTMVDACSMSDADGDEGY